MASLILNFHIVKQPKIYPAYKLTLNKRYQVNTQTLEPQNLEAECKCNIKKTSIFLWPPLILGDIY